MLEIAQGTRLSDALFWLSELRIAQTRYADAEALLVRCLEIRREKKGLSNEAIANVIRKLADVYRLMGRDSCAEELLSQVPPF